MIHDSGGPRRVKPILDRLQRQVWDKDKIVVVTDHYVPADNAETQAIQALTKQWVQDQSIDKFYDEQGICHIVLPERGHLAPGLFCVGGDSHSPTGGAFGAYMFGIGATEMAGCCNRRNLDQGSRDNSYVMAQSVKRLCHGERHDAGRCVVRLVWGRAVSGYSICGGNHSSAFYARSG